MAGDWIKIRRGLRQSVKVVAIARYLSIDRSFMNWWSDPTRHTCHESVTEIVTFENVTRVTVCALADLWFAVNDVVCDSCHVPYMCLSDIDDITGIPSFGEAMLSVGWVSLHDESGLIFPNFFEHNTPEKSRPKAKTQAERAREYRERKKVEGNPVEGRHDRHESSHREEKRREDNKDISPNESDATTFGGVQEQEGKRPKAVSYSEDFERFWAAFPPTRRTQKGKAHRAWKTASRSADAATIIAKAIEYAASEKGRSQFATMPTTFLNGRMWEDDPIAWRLQPDQTKQPINQPKVKLL